MHSYSPKTSESEAKFFYGYIIVAAGFLTLLIVYGAQYSFGVFLKPLLTEFGWSRSVISGAYSLTYVFGGVWSIFAGRISDRFGPRLVVMVGGLLVSFSYLLMSQITAVWQIYLTYGVLLSIGMAAVFVPVLSTVARWFIAKRGLVSGIVIAGIGIGITIMPPLASFLISSYSWRISYIVVGLIALTIPVIIAPFLRRGTDRGVELLEDADVHQDENSNHPMLGFSLPQAIRTRQLWIIMVIFFIMNNCIQTVMVHIVAYATDAGIVANMAATILTAIGIVSIISKVGMGSALDRLRSKTVMIIVTILMLISFLLLQLPIALILLYIFAVIFAASYGGSTTTMSPAVAEYFGLREHGAIYGVVIFAASMGSATGPFIAGLIFDMSGSYNLVIVGCAVLSAVAVILLRSLKPAEQN